MRSQAARPAASRRGTVGNAIIVPGPFIPAPFGFIPPGGQSGVFVKELVVFVLFHPGECLGPTAARRMNGTNDEGIAFDFDLHRILEAALLQDGFWQAYAFRVSNAHDVGFHG